MSLAYYQRLKEIVKEQRHVTGISTSEGTAWRDALCTRNSRLPLTPAHLLGRWCWSARMSYLPMRRGKSAHPFLCTHTHTTSDLGEIRVSHIKTK